MKIDTVRTGGVALLRLEGRLDREWAEHLSGALQRLLQEGVRSLRIDLSGVTYVSSAATQVLSRWRQELAMLRGEVQFAPVPGAVQEAFEIVGWSAGVGGPEGRDALGDFQRSSWHVRSEFAACGLYEFSTLTPGGGVTCRLHGDPARLARAPYGPGDCATVAFSEQAIGIGLGAIGRAYEECHERFGELVAAGGCIAYFPTDGARMADYLAGGGPECPAPRAVLASGLSCEGEFSHLIRFSPRPEAEAIPLSEVAASALEAVGGGTAALVIAGETAGLSGVRLRRSPGQGAAPVRFETPAVRDWLLFAPERIHAMTTTVIAGVVSRAPVDPLAPHLRAIGEWPRLYGHFHAAVFGYRALPQRTVGLAPLMHGLFANQHLRDVVHLVRDDRGQAGVRESELIRGVAWAAPVSGIERAAP